MPGSNEYSMMPEEEKTTEVKVNEPNDTSLNPETLVYDGFNTNTKRITEFNSDLDKNVSEASLIDSDINSGLVFFPRYKISNYSRDILNWRQQLNPFATKGFFYFKIFFNFDTNYGLLGGGGNSLNTEGSNNTVELSDTNTAYQYLNSIEDIKLYNSEKIKDRKKALVKFINGLKNISLKTPWFFKEVNNLNNINPISVMDGDFDNQSFNIICGEESVDMRLGTLFDLYKFACYNSIRNKEIIPANLRKFEVSILFMHVPIRNYQTAITDLKGNTATFGNKTSRKILDEKELDFNSGSGNKKYEMDNTISVKMLTFQNCEFDVKSMNEIPDNVSNEASFDLGKNIIKINYSRVYEHRINEWEEIGFGQDGFMFDEHTDTDNSSTSLNQTRLNYLADKINGQISASKSMLHAGEKGVNENLYGNFTNIHSIYQTQKRKVLKEGGITGGNIYNYDYGRVGLGTGRKNTDYLNKKLNGGHPTQADANPNEFKLSWNANALNYNNNMFDVEGNPGNAKTFFGKLGESTWQRIKSGFGF